MNMLWRASMIQAYICRWSMQNWKEKKNHKWITFLLSPEIVWTSSKSCFCKEFKLSCPYNVGQTTILICSSYAFSCILVNNLIRSSLCPRACPCLETLSLTLYKREMYQWKYNLGHYVSEKQLTWFNCNGRYLRDWN
jgi:hypothetical protein